MALPEVTSWPFKIIDGYKSEWNAANLPIQYDIDNTKWPSNSESSLNFTNVTNDNGLAKLDMASSLSLVAKDWVIITNSDYDGIFQIVSVDGNDLTIDTPFDSSKTDVSGFRS